jgi:voltage-gated potassium channel
MRKALLLILLVILTGTIGYYVLEGWPFLDGFYMTIITIFTVGFREVQPLTPGGTLCSEGA